MLLTIALGQVLSLCITLTATSSSQLADLNNGRTMPAFQTFLAYALLLVVFGSYQLYLAIFQKARPSIGIRETMYSWHQLLPFIALVVLDVEANYLLVLAYRYTSMLSVMALDAWSIPCVFLLGYLLFHLDLLRRFRVVGYAQLMDESSIPSHQKELKDAYAITAQRIVGTVICLAGLAVLLWQDVTHGRLETSSGNLILGDVLVIAGASLYACSNLLQEYVVRKHAPSFVLFQFGLFGSIIGGVQALVLEYDQIVQPWYTDGQTVLLLVVFAVALFMFYALAPLMLKRSSATVFNLSLLTSDFYGAVVATVFFHFQMSTAYALGFGFVILGLCLYHLKVNRT